MFDIVKKLMLARQLEMECGKVLVLGQPILFIPAWYFIFALQGKDEEMGKNIYLASKLANAHGFSRNLMEKFGLKGAKFVEWLENATELGGVGKIEYTKIDWENKQVKISLTDSTVCDLYRKTFNSISKYPINHLTRGFIAGAASNQFGLDIECIETECRAQGKQRCIFIAKPREDFDSSQELFKMQIPKESIYKNLEGSFKLE